MDVHVRGRARALGPAKLHKVVQHGALLHVVVQADLHYLDQLNQAGTREDCAVRVPGHVAEPIEIGACRLDIMGSLMDFGHILWLVA